MPVRMGSLPVLLRALGRSRFCAGNLAFAHRFRKFLWWFRRRGLEKFSQAFHVDESRAADATRFQATAFNQVVILRAAQRGDTLRVAYAPPFKVNDVGVHAHNLANRRMTPLSRLKHGLSAEIGSLPHH
jgi:hypothetical protein